MGEDRGMQISTPEPATYGAMIDLQLDRMHRWERAAAGGLFWQEDIWDYRNFRAAYVDGELAGWGFTARPTTFPPDWGILSITVATEHEGQGIGTALRASVTATLPETAATLVALVDDLDERSLAVAQHWGYAVGQHGIKSQLDLVDLAEPELPADVTIEDATGLEFPDADAVDAMLVDSQTNPEAVENGIVVGLGETRIEQAELDHPFAVLARVDGVPAAIITGEIKDAILLIHYTGVGQTFRGRNLGFLLKQAAHLQAAAAGATRSYTTNEARNAGIRHVNAKLGYQVVAGDYRIRTTR
jgi:GNAT superfamily N-acetyltransferase